MSYVRTAQQNAALMGFANQRERVHLVENWLRKPGINADIQNAAESTRMIANTDFEVLGTNAVTADVTASAGGGIVLSTHGASADSTIVLPHLDTSQSAWSTIKWNTLDKVAIGAKLKTGASIADTTIWYGLKLTNTPVTATDDDQAFFRYQDSVNSGKWQAVYSVGGTDYTADLDVTPAVSTHYELVLNIDADRIVRFYVDGDLKHTATVALTSDIDLIPYVGILSGAVASKTVTVRPGYEIAKDMND